METDQTVGERMIAYYARLAKGGVGLIVVESCGVQYPLAIQHVHYQADGTCEGVQLHLDDDRFIEGFSRLTDAVHRRGCPVSIQLQHAGPWNPTGLLPRDPKVRDVKCASAMSEEELPGPDFLPCRAMTAAEIEDQIDLWASAAERAQKAGFDAVEINHGTCHQGNTFLSRVWNRRDDEYGPQSLENRTRFLRDDHRRDQAPLRARASPCTRSSTSRSTTTLGPRRWTRARGWPSSSARWPTGSTAAPSATATAAASPARSPPVSGAARRPAGGPRLEPARQGGHGPADRGRASGPASPSRCGRPAGSTRTWARTTCGVAVSTSSA